MRVADGHTLLLKPQRLLILPLPVIELSEHAEIEPFTACLPCHPADPQRFFKTVRGLVEFTGHDVDEGGDKEARRQDVLITKGSSRSEMEVNPETSANRTVTCLR